MSIRSILSEFMDLPESMVLGEAKNKLKGTYLTINDRLYKMEVFTDNYITAWNSSGNARSFEDDEINELGLWIPETGVYLCRVNSPLEKKYIYLEKIAKRHYHLSFSWEFYSTPLNDQATAWSLFKGYKVEDYYVEDDRVWFRDRIIGDMHGCANDYFKPEYDKAISNNERRTP